MGYGVVEESHLDRRGLSGDRETVKAGYGVEEAWGEIFTELSLSNIQVRKAELDGVGVHRIWTTWPTHSDAEEQEERCGLH